jgi:hypothetical protein
MSDLLAAASLLLTVVAIIYGLWQPEIAAALKYPVSSQKVDNKRLHKKAKSILLTKAFPLAVIATTLLLINFPDAATITLEALKRANVKRWSALHEFSAVRTSFVMVTCVLGVLAVHTAVSAIHLKLHVRRLRPY